MRIFLTRPEEKLEAERESSSVEKPSLFER
jgi:hypothetical protein